MRHFGRRQLFALGGGAVLGAGLTGLAPLPGPSDDDAEDDDRVRNPKDGGQRVVWSVVTDQPIAALTFDDGPHPGLTPRILDLLDRFGVPASFMMMGHSAAAYPSLVAEVVAAGHDIGNHSWRHLNLARTSSSETRREIEIGAEKIETVSGQAVEMFRPPRGRLNEAALRILAPLRQDIVLWSVTRGPLDWRSPHRVAAHVVDAVGPGDIIDLHDGIGRGTFAPDTPGGRELMERRLVEVAALPRILEGIAAKGIRLVRLSELLPPAPLGSAGVL
jgi:peptidoglycan/xylan/chitin deacetylase (PgdA/CDA1 family)